MARVVQVCPFFATKVIAEEADIVFMPYNYVTDDVSSMHKLLAGAVLILDEAHNVEAVCQDTASFDLSSGARFPIKKFCLIVSMAISLWQPLHMTVIADRMLPCRGWQWYSVHSSAILSHTVPAVSPRNRVSGAPCVAQC